jgi:hypothetical protein
MGLKERWEGMDTIHLVQDRDDDGHAAVTW